MSKQTILRLRTVLITAFAYMAVDIPFSYTNFLGDGGMMGPVLGLAFITGLVYGRQGTIGCMAGAVISLGVCHDLYDGAVWQLAGVLWTCSIPYILWYASDQAKQVELKTREDFLKYAGIVLTVAAGFAVIMGIQSGMAAGGQRAVFLIFWSLVTGAPVMILMTSILGIEAGCRPEAKPAYDLDLHVSGSIEEIGVVNDRIEEMGISKNMDRKAVFRLMGCVEELLLRIMDHAYAEGKIGIRIMIKDTVMISISYTGKRYNPLLTARDSKMEDLIGLKLIMQMSLRASYGCIRNENEIRIIM